MEKPTICRYCGNKVIYTSNSEIYGKEYGNGKCYLCKNCRAFVGVHNGTDIPLGTLANDELRKYRKRAHFWFDKIWKGSRKIKTRREAYLWLSQKLKTPIESTHIGMFEKEQCEQTIKFSYQFLKEKGVDINE